MSSASVYDTETTEWVTDGCRLTASGVAPVIPLQRARPGLPAPTAPPVRTRSRRAGARGPRYARPPALTSPRLTRRGELLVRRVTAGLVVLAVAGILTALAVGVVGLLRPAPTTTSRTVVVQPGQSLWEIARTTSTGGDVRDAIERIRAVNGLTGAGVQAGQRLIVPVD